MTYREKIERRIEELAGYPTRANERKIYEEFLSMADKLDLLVSITRDMPEFKNGIYANLFKEIENDLKEKE